MMATGTWFLDYCIFCIISNVNIHEILMHFHFPAVDQPLHIPACLKTFGGLVDLLIATLILGTMGQLLEVDGVFLKTILHRYQTIHL